MAFFLCKKRKYPIDLLLTINKFKYSYVQILCVTVAFCQAEQYYIGIEAKGMPLTMSKMKYSITAIAVAMTLSGCGGGGETTSTPTTPVEQCTVLQQNQRLYDYLQQDYYWYKSLPQNLDLSQFSSQEALMDYIRDSVPEDDYSFVMSRQEYDDMFVNAQYFGYGFAYQYEPYDKAEALRIAYVYAEGDAAKQGMRRGDKIIEVNGVSVLAWDEKVLAGETTWTTIFGANEAGVAVDIKFEKPDGTVLARTIQKADVPTNTVFDRRVIDTDKGKVGYLVFHSFIERAEYDLEQTFSYFAHQGIKELVLDMRYNSGGLISLANQLSTQIAGNNVLGKTFLQYRYNDKNTSKNESIAFSLGAAVNELHLQRVVVLTTAGTCSAAELVLNSLDPHIDVVQIGEATCGKPVGMAPVQICDQVIFAINFETINSAGVGGYFNGLQPRCLAEDVIVDDWGSSKDALLNTGLNYLATGECPVAVSSYGASKVVKKPNNGIKGEGAWLSQSRQHH